ncbi:unnamed protein product [Spirodela intermedia]|uniref:Uncharacterized protein n=1 Tax=Spirodela intermedia TaxID=51605 RepID=A0ABN7ECN1_SPIIN|nr:unnamed protein product [Spirodela intermedia]CAA6675675.1 unnamed protein product [Spirodela intermedia]
MTHRPAKPASESEAKSGVATSRGSSGLAWTDRGMCVPLPFHVTSGQPAVGQGVVAHVRVVTFKVTTLACTTTPCPTTSWPPVTWKESGAHVPLSI